MKKCLALYYFVILSLIVISCEEPNFGEPVNTPECDFSGTKTFSMSDFGLKLPNIQSANISFHNAFNVGGVIYDLNTLLETKGDYRYPENDAAVYGKFTADGTYCNGEKAFEYKKNSPNVMINSVSVPIPSNSEFFGEVVIKSKTDSFREQGSGYNQGFYIRWEVTENNPDNFVEGNIQGEKIGFNYDTDLMYIPEIEEPIYIDGNWGLPSEP